MKPEDIDAEHNRLGYKLGWRFMTGPAALLTSGTTAIIGLNPGGSKEQHSKWSQEAGSSYEIESWKGLPAGTSDLQMQVKRMCEVMEVTLGEVFGAYFVPFRSKSWEDLPRQDDALSFSRRLWEWALPKVTAKRFVCIGKGVTAPEIASLLGARPRKPLPAGWGKITIERYATNDGRLVIGLPHLSRFGLFGRDVSERAFRDALAAPV